MLRFVASFFSSNSSNIKPTDTTNSITSSIHDENSRETIITSETETEELINPPTTEAENSKDFSNETISEETEDFDEEDISLIQSLRQQQKQELLQKILLRRISHQAIMNHYAQDHIPLSQLQEKLEEDNLPLIALQERLKQRDSGSIYTTTKENINFLLYNNPQRRLLTRLKKPKPTSETSAPKDIRDYDVWDDAIIGRLMNLIDTIGMETEESSGKIAKEITSNADNDLVKEVIEAIKEMEKEATEMGKEITKEMEKEITKGMKKEITKKMEKEVTKEGIKEVEKEKEVEDDEKEVKKEQDVVVKETAKEEEKELVEKEDESEDESDKESYTFSEESAEDDDDKETIIAESSIIANSDTEGWDKMKCESVMIAEEIINFGETINVAESLTISSNESSVKNTPVNEKFSRTKIDSGYGENSISVSTINNDNKRESKFLRKRRPMLPLSLTIPKSNSLPEPLTRNNNISRKSSIHSRKSYENDISRRSSISSKLSINTFTADVITEEPNEEDFDEINCRNKLFTSPKRYPQKHKSLHFLKSIWKSNQSSVDEEQTMERQDDGTKPNHEFKYRSNLQRSKEGSISSTGTAETNPDHGYSNFYLAMPNGKWMVRTRTASRKITGTQYVDKEYI